MLTSQFRNIMTTQHHQLHNMTTTGPQQLQIMTTTEAEQLHNMTTTEPPHLNLTTEAQEDQHHNNNSLTTEAQQAQDLNNVNLIYSYNYYVILRITICIFGIPGNFIIIKIMRGKGFNKMAHSILCVALAIINSVYLLYVLCVNMLEMYFGSYLVDIKLCKFNLAVGYFCVHLDAGFLTFLTYERVIAIFFPFKISQIVTKIRVKIVITIMIIFYLLLDSVF